MAQTAKNLPAMQGTQVWSLGREDPQEKAMAAHSRILVWEISQTEEPRGAYSPLGHKRSDMTKRLTLTSCNFINNYAAISEKAMAPHSSTLAWKIPWMEEPGRLQSMGSLRVGHDWATSRSLFTFMHWRTKWQPTPVFLPGESQGRGSLVGCQTSMGSHRVGQDWSDLAACSHFGLQPILA